MKQILQSLKTGATEIAEVPCPAVQRGQLLIRSTHTLVSAGTERMLVEFGKAGWIEKARQQPDKVRMVLDKIKTDGLLPTVETVFNKLDQPLPLGYCNVGTVLEAGPGVTGFATGDRVVSNGKHAEAVGVPVNLCAKVPDTVSDEEAACTVLGAIALQGIRLIDPTLGETVVVTGLGLIGLLAVQLLRAQGCRVLGLDFDTEKLALARRFGAETVDLAAGQDPLAVAQAFSRGRGVDAVLITASTRSNEPVHQAARMCRQRGRIVLVGVTGLELSRADFYEKELTFQVSCSYGPGRYDPNYEEKGQDYPVGFVRWTEQRNFEAVLDLMAENRLDVKPLISHRFAMAEAEQAYALVGGAGPSLGILLHYPTATEQPETALRRRTVALSPPGTHPQPLSQEEGSSVPVSFIGAGNYATAVLIPAFKAAGARLQTVVSNSGVSGLHAGRKFGFAATTTDTASILADADTRAVVITTRHDSHAGLVLQALAAGKHVFVEKPLCLTLEDLAAIEAVFDSSPPLSQGERAGQIPSPQTPLLSGERSSLPSHPPPPASALLMVGFNRRFAPQVQKIKALLASAQGPKALVMTVNAGAIPSEHWTQDRAVGGGRIVGEACHFIDLLRFLAGAPIAAWRRLDLDSATGDTVSISLRFADGSIGTVHYFANGAKAFPKERLEVFAAGRVLQLDNFRKLTGYGWPGFKKLNLWRQDKGQRACAAAFVRAIEQGSPAPISLEEILEVSRITIELAGSAGER
ncbi:MAG TPA: bi-domain-containing oxidoreductase [Candidatus Competibacter sp.]|nr:bi-domain-containing oxidoreductase [Candidatus Competibacter sp.]